MRVKEKDTKNERAREREIKGGVDADILSLTKLTADFILYILLWT